ncbi:MAG TPA: tetratricopeptide repeat protein, partial [Gemmataceae bacterium]|nr:tetratricopeptide repeat protein [Gemmataceae bacterium]
DVLEAWEAKGRALTLAGRGREGLAAFETVLAAAPRRELALAGAATLAQLLDRLDPAIGYWRQAVEANPYAAAYRGNLARLLAHKGDWAEARVHCQAWLELDPGSTDARELWVRCLVREGRKEQARAEFARLERLGPSNLAELRAWFAVHGR